MRGKGKISKSPSEVADSKSPQPRARSEVDELEQEQEEPNGDEHQDEPEGTRTPSSTRMSKKGSSASPEAYKFAEIPLPHYTIKRQEGSQTSPHIIKIHTGITDASNTQWPIEDEYYAPILANDPKSISSKKTMGKGLAILLGEVDGADKTEVWTIERWPDHYKYYQHQKPSSNGQKRHDPYLYGSLLVSRFRSVAETVPHLHWLLMNGPGHVTACECKYCNKGCASPSGRKRKSVSAGPESAKRRKSVSTSAEFEVDELEEDELDEDKEGSPSLARPHKVEQWKAKGKGKAKEQDGAKEQRKEKEKEKEQDQDQAVSQPVTIASSTSSIVPSTLPSTSELPHSTLTASTSKAAKPISTTPPSTPSPPVYRAQELVWARLDPPLSFPSSDRQISWWPALVVAAPGLSPPPSQSSYSIRLLALSQTVNIALEPASIRPWLTFDWKNELPLPAELRDPESVALIRDGKTRLQPSLKDLVDARRAATTYGLALHTANYITDGAIMLNEFGAAPAATSATDPTIRQKTYDSFWWGSERILANELVRLVPHADLLPYASASSSSSSDSTSHPRLFFKLNGVYKNYSINGDPSLSNVKIVGRIWELIENGMDEDDRDESLPLPSTPDYSFRLYGPSLEKDVIHLDIGFVAGRYYPLPDNLRSVGGLKAVVGSLMEEERSLALSGIGSANVCMPCGLVLGSQVTRKQAIDNALLISETAMQDFLAFEDVA